MMRDHKFFEWSIVEQFESESLPTPTLYQLQIFTNFSLKATWAASWNPVGSFGILAEFSHGE